MLLPAQVFFSFRFYIEAQPRFYMAGEKLLGLMAVCGLGILISAYGIAVSSLYLYNILLFQRFSDALVGVVSLVVSIFLLYGIRRLWNMESKGWHIVMAILMIIIITNLSDYSISSWTAEEALFIFLLIIAPTLIIPSAMAIYLWKKKGLFR